MEDLEKLFVERLTEIEAYLDLLGALQLQVQSGPPRVGESGPVITTVQQRILYSSVYLQLYNLIEATITKCLEGVAAAILKDGRWQPADLSDALLREWVRFQAQTHVDLNYDHRLARSILLSKHLIGTLPIKTLEIEKGGGGNWDDEGIYKVAERIGCRLAISTTSNQAVKQPFRNEKGAMALIVKLRNDLAHGNVSFVECGDGVTVDELRDLTERTVSYLREVVISFTEFVGSFEFLAPHRRPVSVAR